MFDNMVPNLLHLVGAAAILIVITFAVNSRYYELFHSRDRSKMYKAYITMGIFGGLFGIYANYAGVHVNDAIVSIRDIGPMMAGLFGGPIGGLIAGGIACAHRLTLGGPTVYACSLATLTIGLFCGLLHIVFGGKILKPYLAAIIAVIMEDYHLLLVYIMVKPTTLAVVIIKQVAIPIVLSNAIGLTLMLIVAIYIEKERTMRQEKERMSGELNVATRIQSSMVPMILPTFPGRVELKIQASMTPAKEVGGDFYDIFYVDDDHLALVMADVSGKGIPSALFMVITKTLIKNNLQEGMDPAKAMTKANSQLCENNEEGMFVTVWMCVLEISTGKVVYVNAGHNPPLVTRNGKCEYLTQKSGFILAGMDTTRYKEYEMKLDDGDSIFLYTDGVTEAENIDHKLYGETRLHGLIEGFMDKTPNEIVDGVKAAVDEFAGEAEQFDDITMMAMTMSGGYSYITISPAIEEIEKVTAFAEETLEKFDIPVKIAMNFNICIDEILSNVINYSGSKDIKMGISYNNKRVSMKFIDNGEEYDPKSADEPDITASVEDRKIGGLGIFMMKKMMDIVEYERYDDKNVLTIRKFI